MAATLSTSRLRSVDLDQTRFLNRWLNVWVVLLSVVTLVVVVYLIVITNSLASINKHLGVADRAVTGAGGHTKTLPDQIQGINGSLAQIDVALKPIPGQADQIIGALTSINGSLQVSDGSLKDTEASLNVTSSSLQNTSSILVSVLGLAHQIDGTLKAADQANGACGNGVVCSGSQLGVQNIWQRITNANPILASARGDTANIVGQLVGVNGQLRGICTGPTVSLVSSLLHPGPC